MNLILYIKHQMKRCKAQLISNKQKCSRLTSTNYCWQHCNPVPEKRTYFTVCPIELLHDLILCFGFEDLPKMLRKLNKISTFSTIINSKILWKKIWTTYISSYVPLPENSNKSYFKIFNEIHREYYQPVGCQRVKYLARNAYDILLIPLLRCTGDYDLTMPYVAESGCIELVNFMLSKGATEYKYSMAYAAETGHIEIVKLMLEKGADNYDWAMEYAASHGHLHIVELMLSKGATCYNRVMIVAAVKGYMNIVKLMLEKGADGYNPTMVDAASGGYIDIVELMLGLGADQYNLTMFYAAQKGCVDIVKLMLERGADDYNGALLWASSGGHLDIVKLLLELGANNYVSALEANYYNNTGISRLIKSYMKKRKH